MIGHYGRAARATRWAPRFHDRRQLAFLGRARRPPPPRCPQAVARAAAFSAVFSDQAWGQGHA
eukprot:4541788-Lingulodinium_polyedra.AAC.1